MPDLLIELLSEEIPARMQARATADLKRLVTDGLVEAGLTYAHAEAFATPRRLAMAVEGLSAESPSKREERKGPRVDAPEKALEGFLRSTGLTREQLEERETPKGAVWFAMIETPGRSADEIVAEVLVKTVRNFPWPKSMRWGAGGLRWVRPLHSILCVLTEGEETRIVDVEVDGLRASDTTYGHRFMAPEPFRVAGFDDYQAKLKASKVILPTEERAEAIWHDATQAAFARGLEVIEDKGLLAEVAGLVEWPVVLMGEIDTAYLDLPAEVLQTSMREHQKFFSAKDTSGRITGFVTVANRETADHGATILAGNRKVLAARLADAKFFWENDLRVAKEGMGLWQDALEAVTFHGRLGTQAERIRRIAALASEVATKVDASGEETEIAALIAKADLPSEMVYEFPELQGIMGEYYAKAAGHSDSVAAVAREHYHPLGPSDEAPSAPLSVAVALADKIDTLTGFWAVDEKPTGSKDPFALRRAALGVIRILLENGIRLRLDRFIDAQLVRHKATLIDPISEEEVEELIGEIAEHGVFGAAFRTVKERLGDIISEGLLEMGERVPDASDHLLTFFHERLKVYLRDRDVRHDVIDACLAMPNADDLTLLVARAEALSAFLGTEDGENLHLGFKRAHNLLRQAEEKDGVEYSFGPEAKLAETDEERALFAALDAAETRIAPAMAEEDFDATMAAMAGLRQPIDIFFDAVQINTENAILRRNRLNLLHRISEICLSVADLTRIEG
ncbi:MAG: glycine--tRNA ligase subunit beta [Paracoccaceae bacterium]|nr:glycine--tRNA ligase subunit beta [Paracoccaceae bacterium]